MLHYLSLFLRTQQTSLLNNSKAMNRRLWIRITPQRTWEFNPSTRALQPCHLVPNTDTVVFCLILMFLHVFNRNFKQIVCKCQTKFGSKEKYDGNRSTPREKPSHAAYNFDTCQITIQYNVISFYAKISHFLAR